MSKADIVRLVEQMLDDSLKPYLLRKEFTNLPRIMEVLQDNQAVMQVTKYKLELLEQGHLNNRCDSTLKEFEECVGDV